MNDEESMTTPVASLLHKVGNSPTSANVLLKAKTAKVSGKEFASKGAHESLREALARAQRWQQQMSVITQAAKATQARMPRQDSHPNPSPKELAGNVTYDYVGHLMDVGAGNWTPYVKQFCKSFLVVDPVGTKNRTSKKQLRQVLRDRQDMFMPEGFALFVKAITISQDYQQTAVFSSMVVPSANGKMEEFVDRTDFLTIETRKNKNCISSLKTYWSTAGSLLRAPVSVQHQTTEDGIRNYLRALHELGTNQSFDYFSQFADNFTVHDPLGMPPMTSLQELQTAIPELAKLLAPQGFTVDVEGVTVAANPEYGSAHLVLHFIGGASVDIIDIFQITSQGKVKNLKAVWHIV
eukprot:CAMPEP_0172715590 /NCGR_PEP_ID=MMETSP1074-20121228/67631_1 /TAXON_ID=2916 /ORGANISM="Ceratium fusus, Strain PA161109" /LENGTH=350 /DNA_ID=CAMNT_0013540183 /DNA_START=146 /DNA_END=1198 /DNA_ORIENTATION=+